SEPEGRGAAWTEERGTSDEGRRRLKAPRRRAGGHSEPEGRGAAWTRAEGAPVPPGLTSEGRARKEGGASKASRKRKTAERGTSDEGRRRLMAPRRRAGGHDRG